MNFESGPISGLNLGIGGFGLLIPTTATVFVMSIAVAPSVMAGLPIITVELFPSVQSDEHYETKNLQFR